jgi:photosystem II stability/assembly factor-like uncharacterized protein
VLGQDEKNAAVVGQPGPTGLGDLTAVSCADAQHCWAVGGIGPASTATSRTVIAATANGGVTWKAQGLMLSAPPQLSGISCPAKDDCMAVGSTGSVTGGSVVVTTRDGGATWTQASSPAGTYGISAVMCVSVHQCTAIVNGGLILQAAQTTDFGQTWQIAGNLPGGFQGDTHLSCGADGTCLLAGFTPTTTGHGQGAIVYSLNGGQSWANADVPIGLGVLQAAACSSGTECLAVGSTSTNVSDLVAADGELLTSSDGGQSWARSLVPPPINVIDDVACPGPTVCALVGAQWSGAPAVATGSVAVSAKRVASFHTASSAYIPLPLAAVACPSAVSCIAVGGVTLARISLPTPAVTRPHARRSRTR